jgi:hypothetical protein
MKLKQIDLWGLEHEIKEEVKMDTNLEDKIIKNHQIEPNKKITKLLDERREFNFELRAYIKDPTKDNMLKLIGELADVAHLIIQLAIVRHSINIAEILAIFKEKVSRTHCIKREMDSTGESYNVVRRRFK